MKVLRLISTLCSLSAVVAQEGLGIYFVKEPQSLVAPPGDHVVFTCATNIKVDHLRWQRGWEVLEPGSDPTIDVQPGRLLIRVGRDPDVYRRQTGKYRCMAWIAPIGLTSLPATLSIAHIGSFPARPNTTLVAPPSGTVSIQCPPPSSDPPANLQYFRDGQPVLPHGDTYTLLPNGRLHISDLSADHSGVYTCTASNHLTREQVTSPFHTRLTVQEPSDTAPPTLTVPPDPMYRAAAGTTIRIECVAAGWPVPVVVWRRLDGRWADRRYIRHAASLEIRNLSKEDEGDYVCEVASARGTRSAATVVRLLEPPSVETHPSDLTVPEGSPADLSCLAAGQPEPRVEWVLEGQPVLGTAQLTVSEGMVHFAAVQKHNAGLYQCFAHSELGDAKAAVLLKVIPKTTLSVDVRPSDATLTSTAAPTRRNNGGRRGNNDNKRGNNGGSGEGNAGRRRDDALMVPPSAPRVYPISESSVMLQWDVPPNDGLEILFFKIQYRRAPRRRYDWQTHDTDIPGTARSFEVDGLAVGAKYKFRVLAVYENKDNKHGPNSRKVKMTRMRKKAKPPGAPVIRSHSPLSPSAIRFGWSYQSLSAAPIEGYFIYYRDTTMAGDYSKVTVLGETTKAHILTPLLPSTSYDIKLQAFNLEGGVSDFSPIVTERTLDSPDATTTQSPEGRGNLVPIVTTREADESRIRLYAIVGGVLGLLLLLALLFVLVYYCRSRNTGKQEEAKFGDTSQQINLQHQQPFVSPEERDLAGPSPPGDSAPSPPPPYPFKQNRPALYSESSLSQSIPVAIPTPPVSLHPSSLPYNNNKYSAPLAPAEEASLVPDDDTVEGETETSSASVERRRRIRRKDSIETQRHRLSGRVGH